MDIRSSRVRRWAGLVLTGVLASGVAVMAAGSATAATSSSVAITGVSPHLVAANTANQVITVTGKGFNQDTMSGVTITGAGACTTAPQFIVASPTSLLLKTAGDCAVGAATITIADTTGTATNPAGAATALNFAAAPTLATVDSSHNAVVTDNTSALAYADQSSSVPVGGGSFIRVYAGSTPFANSAATPLTASLGGVALTNITMHSGGDYFVGKVGQHAAGAVTLSVTSGGVSKSFSASEINNFSYAGSTISVVPSFGPSNGGSSITITGTGFGPASTVTIGGTPATSVVVTGTTKITCTVPKVKAGTSNGAALVVVTTGAVTTTLSTTSVYIYLDN